MYGYMYLFNIMSFYIYMHFITLCLLLRSGFLPVNLSPLTTAADCVVLVVRVVFSLTEW